VECLDLVPGNGSVADIRLQAAVGEQQMEEQMLNGLGAHQLEMLVVVTYCGWPERNVTAWPTTLQNAGWDFDALGDVDTDPVVVVGKIPRDWLMWEKVQLQIRIRSAGAVSDDEMQH
jgi:hypothetical protein